MARPKMDPSDTVPGRLALELAAFIQDQNAKGKRPSKSACFKAVRGLHDDNFELVKSYWRKHFMPAFGSNIVFTNRGYLYTHVHEDNNGWIFTRRMPQVLPQVVNLDEAAKLSIPDLRRRLAEVDGRVNRTEHRKIKEELALAQAVVTNLGRLREDFVTIQSFYGDDDLG